MEFTLRYTRRFARLFPRRLPRNRGTDVPRGRPRVLVAGVYVANKPNTADHLVRAFAAAEHLDVTQRWAAVRGPAAPSPVADVTVRVLDEYVPKWTLLGELIAPDAADFDFVLFCDDDIWVGPGFLDRFVALQQRYDLALAQPARTWRSYTDWAIVRRRLGVRARETTYVESGPVVSMDRRFLPLALPFSEESPMGWGYDLVWPKVAEAAGLKIGIVDATPVDHSLRARGVLYSFDETLAKMSAYLSTRDHIRSQDVLRTYR